MKGIDIFSGDNIESFQAIKDSGVEVVYIKATEGKTYTDSTLKYYYEQAKAAGLKVGFYHFLRANNPGEEAQHFLEAVEGLDADCKYAIDVEVNLGQSSEEISSNVRQFADYLISKGKEPCIYTYTSFYKEYLNDSITDLPLWIAEYGVSNPHIDKSYIGFQYSETGNIDGVNGYVDLNTFNEGIFINNIDLIKSVQHDLQRVSCLASGEENADGIIGSKTKAAIKQFRYIVNLPEKEVIDDTLIDALNSITKMPTVGEGWRSNPIATKFIQWFLGINKTSIFDNTTTEKVKEWQVKAGIWSASGADGVIRQEDWNKILK